MDGIHTADTILTRVHGLVRDMDRVPGLAAVVVGDDPRLKAFVRLKKKAAERAGIQFSSYEFRADAGPDEVREVIQWLNKDDTIDGILVELPLPQNFEVQRMLDAIAPSKDVDVLTADSQRAYFNDASELLPPAVGALKAVLQAHNVRITGARAAVFGQSMLIGKPVSHWLETQGACVDRIDEHTARPGQLSLQADLVVSGVGKPGLITEDMVKEGVVVIDYGYERLGEKVAGDVDFASVSPKAGLITPVPGGMGPVVIASVLENLVLLASQRKL